MASWRRPHTVPADVILRFVYAGLMLLTAVYAALFSGYAFAGAWLGFIGLLLLAYATRMLFVGVFVNDEGVLIRRFWRSTLIPWPLVGGVRVEPCSVSTFLWRANPALWVSTGPVDLESPLVRGGSWLAPSFGAGFGRMARVHLATQAFDALFRDLQGELEKRHVTT